MKVIKLLTNNLELLNNLIIEGTEMYYPLNGEDFVSIYGLFNK